LNSREVLFGGTDIDYRDTDVTTQQKPTTNVSNLDTDRLFKLNSECFSLAEQKFKSKELSSEEYQATLKLLQSILQNEVQRLTVPSTLVIFSHFLIDKFCSSSTTSSLINNNNPSTTTSSNPFQPPSLQFPPTTTPSFPFAGFANDTQRHAIQILAAVGASSPYASHYNFLPYIPPLPPAPAPPPFTLLPNTFPSQTSSSTTDRRSPSRKRSPNENSNNNLHSDENNKRVRRNSTTHNFDEENIAAVPSLIDANINTLKKKYMGVIQQLYIGKYQCRLCGLRFTAKQKHIYTHHLDWHYWENRQSAATTSTLLERCRDWYPSLQEWTIHEENLDEQIRNNQKMLTQSRQTKDLDYKSSLSSDIISCSAKGNGDTDDDVSRKKEYFENEPIFFFSVVMFVMIHLKISLMIIEKNGVLKMQ
jgi:hypothetical protein